MKYIRTEDGIYERAIININDIETVKDLNCDFHLKDGIIRFVDYFPKEKVVLEILQKEIKNLIFIKYETNSDYYNYDYKIIEKDDVIKQADTIEELCDEFVHIRGNKKPVHHRRSKWLNKDHNTLKWEVKNGFCIVYGAIWTDKGLIYVSKMNEKGELELL